MGWIWGDEVRLGLALLVLIGPSWAAWAAAGACLLSLARQSRIDRRNGAYAKGGVVARYRDDLDTEVDCRTPMKRRFDAAAADALGSFRRAVDDGDASIPVEVWRKGLEEVSNALAGAYFKTHARLKDIERGVT